MSGETMDLVLADEHVRYKNACWNQEEGYRPLIKASGRWEWKVLENFQVSPATGLFRPTPSNWKIGLSMNTIVTKCTIKEEDMFLSLVPIQTILDGDLNHNFLIDVIGQVLDVSEIKTVPCDLQVTNAYDAYKLIINPICEEADAFRIGLPDDGAIVVIQEDDEEAEKQRIKEQEDAWTGVGNEICV
ncbi:unnamed protein product [Microthlaspi erraticum]|uniref:Uncharacterized protein n=1 Tax=Microthlaspi erraticum TaxID=1685480 RepID=A0A6D2KX79_9BRAS|nr:unnamed protein product [Microthlaspi erraticum]